MPSRCQQWVTHLSLKMHTSNTVQPFNHSTTANMKTNNNKNVWTACPMETQTLYTAINFRQWNSNLMKQFSRSKVKVKYVHLHSTYWTKRGTLPSETASDSNPQVSSYKKFCYPKSMNVALKVKGERQISHWNIIALRNQCNTYSYQVT